MPTTPAALEARPPRKRRRPKSLDGVAMSMGKFFDLPDDGADRWLIDGKVVEFSPPTEEGLTVRTDDHALGESGLTTALKVWRRTTKYPGKVRSGEVGVRLHPDKKSLVGIDVAVFAADDPQIRRGKSFVFVGPPLLAAEIVSSSDRQSAVKEKVRKCLEAGVPLVLSVDPADRSVTVNRPGANPVVLLEGDTLGGFDVLPGFAIPVAEIFEE